METDEQPNDPLESGFRAIQDFASASAGNACSDLATILRKIGLYTPAPEPELDRLAKVAARMLRVPVALITLVDDDQQLFKGAFGLTEPWATQRETVLSHSFCQNVVRTDAPLVIGDTRVNSDSGGSPATREFGVIAYLGIPIHLPDKRAVGSFCVIDHVPRHWNKEDVESMQDLAAFASTEIALRWQLEESRRLTAEVDHFINASPAALYLFDIVERRNIFISKTSAELIGFTPEQIREKGDEFILTTMHPEDHAHFAAHLKRLKKVVNGEISKFEYRMRHPDGTWHWFLSHDVPFTRDGDGSVRQVIGSAVDITERKLAEEALRRSEQRLELALEGAELGMWHWDMKTGHVAYSRRWAEMLGYEPNEVEPHYSSWESLVHPDDKLRVLQTVQDHAEGRIPIFSSEHRLKAKDGTWKWILTSGKVLDRDQKGRALNAAGIHLDITARKEAEAASRAADRNLARILESMAEVCAAFDAEWRYTFVNSQWETLFGMRKEDAIGRTLWDVVPQLKGTIAEECYHKVMTERVPVSFEFLSPLINRWLDVRAFPSADGGVSSFILDVHERKLAEEAIHEANRNKDEFLAMLGHELRNPLSAIRNAMLLCRAEDSDRETLQWIFEVIDRQSSQLNRLVDDLLDVSRISRGKIRLRLEQVELSQIIQRAVQTVMPLIEQKKHRLEVAEVSGSVFVEADPGRLEQIVVNLLNNAAKYTDEGGLINLTISTDEGEAVITVRDTGLGITPEMLPRIFDMFTQVDQSHPRAQGGLGLGLTLVRKLVELHRGRVSASSEGPGRGSEFVVRLPLLTKHVTRPSPMISVPRTSVSKHILVVDDNVDAARGLVRLLQRRGHDVKAAYDSHTALDMAAKIHPEVALVDIGLPGMDGYELARALRTGSCPNALLIAISGYTQEEDRRRSREAGFDNYFCKPVDIITLNAALTMEHSVAGAQ